MLTSGTVCVEEGAGMVLTGVNKAELHDGTLDTDKMCNFKLSQPWRPNTMARTGRTLTSAPVRTAISCRLFLRLSPKPGALTAASLTPPRSLFTMRVASASDSTSSATISSGRCVLITCSRIGSRGANLQHRWHVLSSPHLNIPENNNKACISTVPCITRLDVFPSKHARLGSPVHLLFLALNQDAISASTLDWTLHYVYPTC